MSFETFSPRGLQFSSLVRCKPRGGFDFQLFFASFTYRFVKIESLYLQTHICGPIKYYECRIKLLVIDGKTIFQEVLLVSFYFMSLKIAFYCNL